VHLRKITLKSHQFPVRDCYPFNLELFSNGEPLVFTKPLTFFIGENGTGKSTLLKAIAIRCGIHIWRDEEGFQRRVYYKNRYAEELYRYLEIEWINGSVPGSYFDSEIFRYLAEVIDSWAQPSPALFKYYGGDSLISRSHGQRHIQYFAAMYQKRGLHFLDEPENALSPKKQIELLKILKETSATGQVQFIAATHSPILLSYPEATIYSFDGRSIQEIRYQESDYYKIYREFLNNPDRYLKEI
jgi:predicted ATPase